MNPNQVESARNQRPQPTYPPIVPAATTNHPPFNGHHTDYEDTHEIYYHGDHHHHKHRSRGWGWALLGFSLLFLLGLGLIFALMYLFRPEGPTGSTGYTGV